MPKISRHGQAEILSEHEVIRIRKQLTIAWQQLFWDIARFTGERWGAICQLQVNDVYRDSSLRQPHTYITFRARTRKGNPDGSYTTRQLPIHPALADILRAYQPPIVGWLFPSPHNDVNHIRFITVDKMLRLALDKCGLGKRGISTHSTRRTFITNLHRKGVDMMVLSEITGHKDFKALSRYIQSDPERIKQAIACL